MYITAQDLEDVMSESTLIALSNDTSRATTANQMTLDKACEYATETVDGYLRSRYVIGCIPAVLTVKGFRTMFAKLTHKP